jgi:hypothetical protein
MCNHHICVFACYKLDVDVSKKLCKYKISQTLINKTILTMMPNYCTFKNNNNK